MRIFTKETDQLYLSCLELVHCTRRLIVEFVEEGKRN